MENEVSKVILLHLYIVHFVETIYAYGKLLKIRDS